MGPSAARERGSRLNRTAVRGAESGRGINAIRTLEDSLRSRIASAASIASGDGPKHGVIGLTKALALELGILGKNGITANAICPGSVDTPMIDAIASQLVQDDESRTKAVKDRIASRSIQRRLLDPEEIAHMAVYLASDQARGITGQAINVCAGTVLF